ncbi:hypothetical protein D9M71_558750 [compost metagenome]
MAKRNLPPLEVGQAYVAAEFEHFEYCGSALMPAGQKAILRLHLKNGTTIDLPASDAELLRLAHVMAAAFPQEVISVFRENGWI